MRVLVTGSRDWEDQETVRAVMGRLPIMSRMVHGDQETVRVVDGEQVRTGLDRMAARICLEFWHVPEPHPADWAQWGKSAGPRRNQEMVDRGADLCVAFPLPGSVGTWDCMRRATAAGIPVVVAGVDGWLEQLEFEVAIWMAGRCQESAPGVG